MDHLAHVRLIDPHPERARRHDHAHLVAEECAQHPTPDTGTEAGVIGCRADTGPEQCASHELRQPPGGRIHERGTGSLSHALTDHGEPFPVVYTPTRRLTELERC